MTFHCFLKGELPDNRPQLGWGNSAHAAAYPCDMMARLEQVRALAKGGGARVIP